MDTDCHVGRRHRGILLRSKGAGGGTSPAGGPLEDRRSHRAADQRADVHPDINSDAADVRPDAGPNGAPQLYGREGHLRCPHGNNDLGLAEGLVKKLDEGSVDGAGMDEGPGGRTDDDAGLAEVRLELEARQSEVGALRAEIDEGAAGRRRVRQGMRPVTTVWRIVVCELKRVRGGRRLLCPLMCSSVVVTVWCRNDTMKMWYKKAKWCELDED